MNRSRPPGPPIGREELVNLLSRTFLEGDVRPGDRLPSERQLAERFSVSRPVVREAMQRLRERGLIHTAPGSGTYLRESGALDWARPLDALSRHRAATIRELVEARLMLELRAAELACDRATPADLAALEKALDVFTHSTNVLDRARADIVFHSLVARASHNPVIEMMFGSIAPLVFEVMLRSLGDPAVTERGAPLHETLLEALKNRDSTAATQAMGQHISLASEMFGDDLDVPLDSIARRKGTSLLGLGVSLEDFIAEVLHDQAEPA